MNYREKIREAISSPNWGALRFEQRKLIKSLLDDLENTQLYCFKSEKDELQERIDKAIEYNEHLIRDAKYHLNLGHLKKMKKILLGEDNKEIVIDRYKKIPLGEDKND